MSISIADKARNQYRGMFRHMAVTCQMGHRWNLYRINGTDSVALMSDHADGINPEKMSVMVADVHAMTEPRMLAKIQSVIRG